MVSYQLIFMVLLESQINSSGRIFTMRLIRQPSISRRVMNKRIVRVVAIINGSLYAIFIVLIILYETLSEEDVAICGGRFISRDFNTRYAWQIAIISIYRSRSNHRVSDKQLQWFTVWSCQFCHWHSAQAIWSTASECTKTWCSRTRDRAKFLTKKELNEE